MTLACSDLDNDEENDHLTPLKKNSKSQFGFEQKL
jgi:hypothetical protein